MTEIRIDLYSDTSTKPTCEMRAFMCAAMVGDEQKGEDPSVNQLQEQVAELLGKEAALFLPSGTMCNQVAFATHCAPGDLILLDRSAHPLTSEAGGAAVIASADDGGGRRRQRPVYSATAQPDSPAANPPPAAVSATVDRADD